MSDIVYLTVSGKNQGLISARCGTPESMGNRWQIGHENEILVLGLSYSTQSTSENINLHEIKFCKQIDKSSPLFSNSININEQLYLEFYFYRINRIGRYEKYYFIRLRGAFISSIYCFFDSNLLDTEIISIRYKEILCKHLIANTEFHHLAFPSDYNDLFTPDTNNALKTLNSKAVGRLLAAGGIYNNNISGFKQIAEKLGGNAPDGYKQVMDNKGLLITAASVAAGMSLGRLGNFNEVSNLSKIPLLESPKIRGYKSETGTLLNAEHAVIDPKKLASYALNPEHPIGGNKARVFESALGYNSTNADILASRVQEGILNSSATTLDANKFGQLMAVDMPILGVNGETVLVRTGWIYETNAVVPRMTTIFVK